MSSDWKIKCYLLNGDTGRLRSVITFSEKIRLLFYCVFLIFMKILHSPVNLLVLLIV